MGARRDDGIDGVTYLGTVSETEKRDELAAAEIHVAPNLGGESFGIVAVEAMASGAALVVSDIPAFRFVARDEALFTPPGDPDRLAGAVSDLLGSPGRIEEMGSAARQRSLAFEGSQVAAAYRDAYEEALG